MTPMPATPKNPYVGLVPVQQRGMTVWAERRPGHCPAGHQLRAGKILVGWVSCRCSLPAMGHRTYLCQHLVDGRECGLLVHSPPHNPQP
jgi:hypothetical protein